MKGSTFKRCGCREGLVPAVDKSGQPILKGSKPVLTCPKLKSGRHGSWYFQIRVPGRKSPVRKGGFTSQSAAEEKLAEFKRLRGMNVAISGAEELSGDYFDRWLASKVNLSPATRANYRRNIHLYLRPALGHIPLGDLRPAHGDLMFTAIRVMGQAVPTDHPARAEYERMMAVRKQKGRYPRAAAVQRISVTLNSALNDAVKKRVIPFNPMQHVELEEEPHVEPLLWTDARVEEWRRTGKKPGPVMVWSPEQIGAFLDSIVDEPLYAFFHLLAYRGVRRGEGAGLGWEHVDLDRAEMRIEEQRYRVEGAGVVTSPPKAGSRGVIPLDALTVDVLRLHRKTQSEQRLALGDAWVDSGRVFTRPDGSALDPNDMTLLFNQLVAATGLPPIRLHDLRHGAASLTYKATKDMKIVQRLMRHKVFAMTTDRYTSLFADVESEAAEAAAAVVPRRRVPTASPQSGSAAVIPAQFPTPPADVSAGDAL